MNDSLGLLKDLPQRANQLLDIWPKELVAPPCIGNIGKGIP